MDVPPPRRRREDENESDADSIPADELPGHTYRELYRLRGAFGRYRDQVDERLDKIEQALFGYAEGTTWVIGLLQSVADMRTDTEKAAQAAEKSADLQVGSRAKVRQNVYIAVAVLGVSLLNGLAPHWGAAIGGAINSVVHLFR